MTCLAHDVRMSRLATLIGCALVAGCSGGGVTGIQVASVSQLATVSVSEVEVTMEIPRPNPSLQAALRGQLQATMPKCARGDVPHKMFVAVTDFEDVDVAKAVLIGDEIELEGRVSLFNAETDEKIGEYYVENNFFWGGVVGAAMMSDAEQTLSADFAASVCEKVFGVTLEE